MQDIFSENLHIFFIEEELCLQFSRISSTNSGNKSSMATQWLEIEYIRCIMAEKRAKTGAQIIAGRRQTKREVFHHVQVCCAYFHITLMQHSCISVLTSYILNYHNLIYPRWNYSGCWKGRAGMTSSKLCLQTSIFIENDLLKQLRIFFWVPNYVQIK